MEQIRICPLHYRFLDFADVIFDELRTRGINCAIDPWRFAGTSPGELYAAAENAMVIIGEREYESDTLTVYLKGAASPVELTGEELAERYRSA
jgi:hypothetical protein